MSTRPAHRSLTDPRHLMRFLRAQANGGNLAEIAKKEGVSVQAIKSSVMEIERYRSRNTNTEMDFAIRDFVISSVPAAKESLDGLLKATELVEVKDLKTGKTRYEKVDDKTTRLEATRIVKDLIIGMQPKAAAVNMNVEQTNQVANMSSAETMEERLDRLRAQKNQFDALPPTVAAVPDDIDAGDDDDEGDDDEGEE